MRNVMVIGGGCEVRTHPRGSRSAGSATAEFAVALLAVVAAVVPLLSGIELVIRQAQVQEVARSVARQVARGDNLTDVSQRASSVMPTAQVASWRDGPLTRIRITADVRLLMGMNVQVSADATTMTEVAL